MPLIIAQEQQRIFNEREHEHDVTPLTGRADLEHCPSPRSQGVRCV